MSFWTWVTGESIAEPIEAIGNAADKIFTNDEERMKAQAVLDRIALQPSILQAELNKVEAKHRSVFVAGWRPAVGWICALGLAFAFIGNPLLERFVGGKPVVVPFDMFLGLGIAMLGIVGLRMVEKMQGKM